MHDCLKRCYNIILEGLHIIIHTRIYDFYVYTTNQFRRKRQSSGCFPTGLYGGKGGGAFHELLDDCQATIKKIVLRTGSLVDSVQVTYRLSNGKDYTAGVHGGKGGHRTVIEIDVQKGEKIIGAFGKTGRLVDNIGFFTNQGRVFGPYGGKGGGDFSVHLCSIRGVFGRVGSLVDSIGFYCGKLSC